MRFVPFITTKAPLILHCFWPLRYRLLLRAGENKITLVVLRASKWEVSELHLGKTGTSRFGHGQIGYAHLLLYDFAGMLSGM